MRNDKTLLIFTYNTISIESVIVGIVMIVVMVMALSFAFLTMMTRLFLVVSMVVMIMILSIFMAISRQNLLNLLPRRLKVSLEMPAMKKK